MKNHLSEDAAVQMTVVNPPPAQQMNQGYTSANKSTRNGTHTNLEIRPV